MAPVQRSEILDWMTYEDRRAELRPAVLAAKAARRIVVGEPFTFLFENRDTIRYQVQEMVRTERLVREADIEHELAGTTEQLVVRRELGCTLLIGIDDEGERATKLRAWLDLPRHVYVVAEDGSRVRATFDPRQVGDDRLSSVQYLKFRVGPRAPLAIGIDRPGLELETQLSAEQRAALQIDLDAG